MPVIKPAEDGRAARGAVVLDLGDLARQGEAILARAREQAQALLEEARAQRQRLLAGAEEQGRAQGRAQGIEEGRAAGLAQGREAALAEWRERLAALETAWTEALADFERRREEMIEDARLGALRLALAVARRLVARALDADPSPIAAQVEAVLRAQSRPSALALRVHPDDLEAAKAALPTLLDRLAGARHAEVAADAGLARGACVAHTPGGGVIDASLDEQLDRIAAALLPGGAGEPA